MCKGREFVLYVLAFPASPFVLSAVSTFNYLVSTNDVKLIGQTNVFQINSLPVSCFASAPPSSSILSLHCTAASVPKCCSGSSCQDSKVTFPIPCLSHAHSHSKGSAPFLELELMICFRRRFSSLCFIRLPIPHNALATFLRLHVSSSRVKRSVPFPAEATTNDFRVVRRALSL